MDGWFNEGDQNKQHAGSSSSTTPGADRLFDQYRRSFCSVESGCVDPGLADKEGLDYLEVEESRLATSAATQLPQRQFYREAGIKTAIFMGCTSGSEIDRGLPTTSNINVQMGTRPSLFSDEFIQQYSPRLGEIFPAHEQSWPSSSSSSLHSVSVGSPEYSNSLIMTTASTSSRAPPVDTAVSTEAAPTDHQHEPTGAMAPAAAPPQVTAPMKAYGPQTRRRVQYFPTPAADDAAMASAMLAVISASSDPSPSSSVHPSALSSSHGLLQAPQVMMEGGRRGRAFRSYNPAPLAPRAVEPAAARRFSHGQRMIKTAHEILRQVGAMSVSPMRVPTSNQLHHMIAERKRREKLNESFTALRMLLPQGTKKDKASILTKAKECLNSLKAQISELEEKNLLMEARLSRADDAAEEAASRPAAAGERVRIQVVRSPAASSSSDQSTVRIQLRVTVWAECDTLDLVLPILECVKEMGNASVASLQADGHSSSAQTNPVRRATVTLRIEQGGEWDEGAFKESIAKAVDGALRTPQTSPAAAAAAHHEKLRLL